MACAQGAPCGADRRSCGAPTLLGGGRGRGIIASDPSMGRSVVPT